MALPEFAGIAAGIISLVIGYLWYLVTIIRGSSKPHPLTWLILTAISIVMVVTLKEAGAQHTIWVPLSNLAFSFIVFLLSAISYWKHQGEKSEKFKFRAREKWVALLVLLALGLFLIFHEAEQALYLVLIAEVLALSLTLEKTIKCPESESWVAWAGAVVANGLNWFAILDKVEYVYVLVTGVADFVIFLFAFWGYLRLTKEKK